MVIFHSYVKLPDGSDIHWFSYPICSMYGIFTYKTGWFLGQILVYIPYMEHMGLIFLLSTAMLNHQGVLNKGFMSSIDIS